MSLFLNNKWNFHSKSKIAPNSTNINKIEILTVLQDFFIHETQDDIFNNKKYAAEAAQNHYNALNDKVESLRSTVCSPSFSFPFIWYGQ